MSKAQLQLALVEYIHNNNGVKDTYTRKELTEAAEALGQKFPHWAINKDTRVSRNVYALPAVDPILGAAQPVPQEVSTAAMTATVTPISEAVKSEPVSLSAMSSGFTDNLIPAKDPMFVPFGNFKTISDVIKSRKFFNVFITGLSGNGKTHGVMEACARAQREVIRVNFTIETDEDDLIGGFRLVDGETKFFKGPVITAMERGAVLLCDEIDLANPARIMCLQSILEGSGYFIKKTGEYIEPADGFTVVATANTKGKGSDTGQFIGTNVLNEAFLERFPITCEQEYPSPVVEKKILGKVFESNGLDSSDEFIEKLIDWADIIRKTYADGGVDEIISTRRLTHIAGAFSIFGDKMKAIQHCVNRFDDETKESFLDLYTKVDAGVETTESEADDNPFAPL